VLCLLVETNLDGNMLRESLRSRVIAGDRSVDSGTRVTGAMLVEQRRKITALKDAAGVAP